MSSKVVKHPTEPDRITFTELPNLTFYLSKDGHVSVAECGCWVSAFFESLEAAKSWAGHMVDAEIAFRLLNGETGGDKLLPLRNQHAR